MALTPTEYGEGKHETCRFGVLTEAYRGVPSDWKPAVIPLCTWKPADPHPPGLDRSWGGAVELDRDCAVCLAHQPVGDD